MSYLVTEPAADRSHHIKRFMPRYWTLDMPLEVSGSIRTLSSDSLRADAVFRRNGDIAGIMWHSDHPYDHPRFKYQVSKNYTGLVWQFDIALDGDCPRLDALYGATMVIDTASGQSYNIRLWNYRKSTSNTNPYRQTIRIPFSELYSGYAAVDDSTPAAEKAERLVPVTNISRIMLPLTPRDYLGGEASLATGLSSGARAVKIKVTNGAVLSPGDVITVPTKDGGGYELAIAGSAAAAGDPVAHGSDWGDVVFTWSAPPGYSSPTYEVSVKNATGSWQVLGTTSSTYYDMPVEASIPIYRYFPTYLEWRVRVLGEPSHFVNVAAAVAVDNSFVVRVVPFLGQSNAVGHFTTLSGANRDTNSAATFRRELANALGLRMVQVMPLEVCWGSSAADKMGDDDPVDGTNYWYDLNADAPGPRLLQAVSIINSVGVVPEDAVWAQGENDISFMDPAWASRYTGTGMTQPTMARLQSAWEKIFAYLRSHVNPNLHIWVQKIATPWYGNPPYQVLPSLYEQARSVQESISTAVSEHDDAYTDPEWESGIGEVGEEYSGEPITDNGNGIYTVRTSRSYIGTTTASGTRISIKTAVNAPLAEQNECSITLDNISVTGSRTQLLIDLRYEPAHSICMTDGYDNCYNLTPEFVAERTYSLGYRDEYVLYMGISHFHNFDWTGERWLLRKSGDRVNTPTKLWMEDFCKQLAKRSYELWVSVSYEILQSIIPSEWSQVNVDGVQAATGWSPPSSLVEPSNMEAAEYLANVAIDFLTIARNNGLPAKYQIGEPWWWDGSYSDGKPCVYSLNTVTKYNEDTGLYAPTPYMTSTHLSEAELEVQRPYLEWLGRQLGESTNAQMDIVKAAFPSCETAILVFTPQVLNPTANASAIMNLPPVEQWGPSQFNVLMIEDYDWVTKDYDTEALGDDNWSLMKGTWTMALDTLGYSLDNIYYFSGFVLNHEDAWKWSYVDAAAEIGLRNGAAHTFFWSREQILRDGFIYQRRMTPTVSIQTNARAT